MLQPKTSQSTLTVLARNVLSNLASPEQPPRPITHEHSQDMKLWTLMILPLSPLPTCPMSHQASLWVERLIYQQCKNVSFLNPAKHLFLLDPIFRPQLSSWPQLVSCYKPPNSHQQECTLSHNTLQSYIPNNFMSGRLKIETKNNVKQENKTQLNFPKSTMKKSPSVLFQFLTNLPLPHSAQTQWSASTKYKIHLMVSISINPYHLYLFLTTFQWIEEHYTLFCRQITVKRHAGASSVVPLSREEILTKLFMQQGDGNMMSRQN